MKKTLLPLFLLLLSNIMYSQCPVGDVILKTQAEVDQFINDYSNCTIINGDMIIDGIGITDISGIVNINTIKGALRIQWTSLFNINNLNSIKSIGGMLEIKKNSSLTAILFENLTEVINGVSIFGNTNLVTIKGFNLIERLKFLSISGNYALLEIPAFNKLLSIDKAFNIHENESLISFTAFDSLSCVGDLSIHGNDSLLKVTGFNSLVKIYGYFGGSMRISTNSSLQEIDGFNNLKKAGIFIISGNGSGNPVSISEFNSLEELDHLTIYGNQVIGINGFKNLTTIFGYFNMRNLSITEIVGFNKLTSVGDVDITYNSKLKKIDAFHSLKEIGGDLNFYNNRLLEEVNAFENVEKIKSELTIGSNYALTNLDFLSSLMYVGNLIGIGVNPALVDCSGISNLLNYGHLPNRIDIFDNPSECSTQNEIEINADNDNDGVLDNVDLDDDNDGILDTVEQNGNPNLDTDNDLTPDHLDLDSNNNGCFDTMEAGFEDSDNDGRLGQFPEEVDASGLVINTVDGYTSPLDQNSNGVLDFQDFSFTAKVIVQPTNQTTNDGIIVVFNSSIENADLFQWECSIDTGSTWISLSNDLNYQGVNTENLTINNVDLSFYNYQYRLAFANSNSLCKFNSVTSKASLIVYSDFPDAGENGVLNLCSQDLPIDLITSLGGNPNKNGQWTPSLQSGTGIFDPSVDSEGVYTYNVSDGGCNFATSIVTVNIELSPNAGIGDEVQLCTISDPIDLFEKLGNNPDPNGVWSPLLSSNTGVFDVNKDPAGVYTYTVTNNCGSASENLTISISDEPPNAGEDTNLEICINSAAVDLYDLLKGTPDVGGVWTPVLPSGTGIFDPTIDVAGIYTYTVSNGVCGIDTSEVDVAIYELPNAGEDGNLEICINSVVVDLFDSLTGVPNVGGIWSPSLSSGSGVFDPSTDPEGVYTYTVTNGVCGSDTSEINITINQLPAAGEDGVLDICINSDAVDLFDSLTGIPDAGGIWSPNLFSGTGIIDPSIDNAGVYTYTVINGVCDIDTSEVNVTINLLPVAGGDGSLEICINSNSVDLFDILTGVSDVGGLWTPSLSSGSGVFDPSTDPEGVYTYTVTNEVCGIDTSEINVTITHLNPISDYELKVNEFSNNNSIVININSNLEYKFSLDGINYQYNNTFNRLTGGDYTVYVQEINGCGTLEEMVSVLDFPRFFTPNNDGYSDVWKLNGESNKTYDLYIYDRFGKLIASLNSFENSWDGTYNGIQLPSSDYWFKVVFSDGIVKNGHFTLKR